MVLEYRFLDKHSDVEAEWRLPLGLTCAKKRRGSAAPRTMNHNTYDNVSSMVRMEEEGKRVDAG